MVHDELAMVCPRDGDPICKLRWPTTLRTEDETRANANLIAASPELLKACMMMDKAMNEQQVDKALDFVKSAIAKAKGQTP